MSAQTIFFIGIAAVAALGLSLAFYFLKQKNKRSKHWILFSALRFISFFGVLLLLINPKLNTTTYSIEKPSLVIAVDNSSSIAGFKQGEKVKELMENLQQNKTLNDRFSIQTYSFGKSFKALDSLDFSEKQTNLDNLFTNLRDLYPADQTAPTVLITDGNPTYGQDFVFQAKRYAQPVFPVVVGDTARYEDLRIDRLNANRYAFLNNKFPVEVFVSYQGDNPTAQRFQIDLNGRPVYSERVSFTSEKTTAVINAKLPATKIGVQTYTASLKPLENEKNTANNTRKFAVEIIDQKTKVLLLTDILHPDLGALKKSIEHNQQREASIKRIDENIDFGKYQLVVLYQPNPKFAKVYEQIKQLGLNTLTITGTKTDYDFLNAHQDFFSKEITGQEEDYLPAFNANYSSFQFENIGFDDFPPLNDRFGNIKFEKSFQTLLFQKVSGIKTETPLLATAEEGEQRVGFLFGENSWRWRAKGFLDTKSFDSYDDYVAKLVQYLASNKRRERLSIDHKSFYNSGEPVIISAQYFDKNYSFDPRAKLSVDVKNSESEKIQTFSFLLKSNEYEVDLSSLPAGDYSFSVKVEGEKISKSGKFTIVDFDVESQFMNANVSGLEQIASKLYFPNQVKELILQLENDSLYKPIQKSKQETSPLIDWYYLLAIIAASLSAEWLLRKYYGLI